MIARQLTDVARKHDVAAEQQASLGGGRGRDPILRAMMQRHGAKERKKSAASQHFSGDELLQGCAAASTNHSACSPSEAICTGYWFGSRSALRTVFSMAVLSAPV